MAKVANVVKRAKLVLVDSRARLVCVAKVEHVVKLAKLVREA